MLTTEKRGSQVIINKTNCDIKFGTLDSSNPSTIYLTGKIYIVPQNKIENSERELTSLITNFRREFRYYLNTEMGDIYSHKMMSDLQIPKVGLRKNKKTVLNFQILLMQNRQNKNILSFKELLNKSQKLFDKIDNIFDTLFNNESYKVFKNKKIYSLVAE